MSIRDLFRRPSDTIEGLQKKYRDIEGQKKSLEARADSLRAESLKSDTDPSEQLETIKEELSLSDVAMAETKKQLEKMLEKKIKSDFEGLDADRQEYESQRKNLSQRAGENIGRGVQNLENLNLSFAHVLSRLIREEIISYSTDRRFADQLPIFLSAYQEQINVQSDHVNFRDWKRRITQIEQLEPGSIESKRHVAGRIKQLISA